MAGVLVVPLSWLVRKEPYEIGAVPDGTRADREDSCLQQAKNEEKVTTRGLTLSRWFRTRSLWLISAIWALFCGCVFLILTHIVPHATDIGFSVEQAALIISLMSGTTIAGRVLVGVASDRLGRKTTSLICIMGLAAAMLWLVWSQELWMLYLFAIAFGLAWGGIVPSIGAILGDVFGLGNIGAIFGILELAGGVGGAIGPAIGGLVFDYSGSYSLAFVIAVVALLVTAILAVMIRRETA